MIDLQLEGLHPLSLGDVVERAELLTRVDRKYLLEPAAAGELVDALGRRTGVLEIGGIRQARYESVYFDTPDLVSYRMCVQRRRRRLKIRTRSYLDSRVAFLEAKTRKGDDTTVKGRIPHAWSSRGRLGHAARGYAADALGSVGKDPQLAGDLAVAITTAYRRATLLVPDETTRVTIDTDLVWQLPGGELLAPDALVILETKTSGAASRVDQMLWRAGHRPTSISKYATGLAALRPDLPHNRWARLLRERFRQP